MSTIQQILISIFIISHLAHAEQKIKVVTTTPDLAEVVKTVGGDFVDVQSLLAGSEDIHYVDAKPSFIKKISDADVVCFMGLDLEIGWLPKVIEKSGNAKVQKGGSGYCDASVGVKVIEKFSGSADRSMGDVHAHGNPHYNLSPLALAEASEAIVRALIGLKPDKKNYFELSQKKFVKKMESIVEKLKATLQKENIKGNYIEYHKEFSYVFNIYNLKSLGAIEEKPGVPPSALRLSQVADLIKKNNVSLALAATYSPEKHLQKLKELSGINYVQLPTMVSVSNEQYNSIEKLQEYLIKKFLE